MKRDMDLVRQILMQVEEAECVVHAEQLGFKDTPIEEVVYHIDIMHQRGLIDAKVSYRNGHVPYSGSVLGLTWDGHDFLDAVRSDTVWKRTKETVKVAVGSTTMETIKKTAVWLAEQAIRMNLGI